ncbi:unnamed protein product [Pararhodospirillum photometricum DSM 122]|uniref:Uncharacterized protein n=1 Tax=Pararhodospirillum photometricum DSM 122 TaxID=1150469 RepID=H6SLV8_PARPM|nr:unnamed protein product [Pararhodospirillum photometricum DSM 122]
MRFSAVKASTRRARSSLGSAGGSAPGASAGVWGSGASGVSVGCCMALSVLRRLFQKKTAKVDQPINRLITFDV